ncbi:TonB-dependent receptor [Paraglaciecola sp. 20A4]|uniref:TonB-dependent receptor n=1 Tax=Paraglaciecola sp. 20A4 TaxID=2687288 RepID=UPI00140AD0A4|nr:TonB-dependent receptor [Paraglaciecola sp. 20A4]
MKNIFRIATLAAAMTAILGGTQLAMAQELEDVDSTIDATQQSKAKTLEVVTVTAQRKVQNLQTTPIAVTSVSGDDLLEARVFNAENINAISPSISFRTNALASSSSNIQIRGIGTTGTARVFEGAVGVFIDGVYRSRSGQALGQFLDIDQLQVLRGPQGTLFGKNTSAGALLLSSVRADTDDMSGSVGVEFGDYNKQLIRGVINVPIGDNAAFRFAGVKSEREVYFNDPNDSTKPIDDSEGFKAQLLFTPTDNTEIRIIADYSKQDNDCCFRTADIIDGPLRPLVNSFITDDGRTAPSSDPSDFEATLNSITDNITKDSGISVYVTQELDIGTLSYIGAIREYDVNSLNQDGDFSGADILKLDETFKSEFVSNEISLSGQLEGDIKADYVIGAYYSTEDLTMGRDLGWGNDAQMYWDTVFGVAGLANAAPGDFTEEDMQAKAESAAIFTQWDFTLNEKFNLIIGARYSQDKKDGSFANPLFRDPQFDPLALASVMPGLPYSDSFKDSSVSGTVILQYKLNDDIMTYASYNRGYKSGGINTDVNAAGTAASPASPEFESETTDSWELGLKSDWLENSARTNLAVFYTDISELQISSFTGLFYAISNAPSALSYGLEIEQSFQLNDNLTMSGAVTWLPKAEYGNDPILGDIAGRRFTTAPKVAANIALNGYFEITSELNLTGKIEAVHTGEVFTTSAINTTQDAVTLVNASIAIGSDNAGWQVGAYVQNLTDETYVTTHYSAVLQAGSINGFIGSPRTVGINAKYSF